MLISEAMKVYKTRQAMADAARVSLSAAYQWGDDEDMVPPLSAAKLAKRSHGKLKFDPDRYDGWNNRKTSS